jgi:hypothetical protein
MVESPYQRGLLMARCGYCRRRPPVARSSVGPPGPASVTAGPAPSGLRSQSSSPSTRCRAPLCAPVIAIGLAALERAGMTWSHPTGLDSEAGQSPLPPNLSATAVGLSFPEESVVSLTMIEDEVCLPPQEEDECLTPAVLLHIAYEVVSQLDNAADFRQLLLEKLSFRDFLVELMDSLQPMVEA